MDIRLLVKDYLDKKGVNDTKFKDNLPGEDWMRGFIRRHNLTQRLADNVKPARAEISKEQVDLYFDELEETLRTIPVENIYNYDEINVTEGPGAKKVVCKRGLNHIILKLLQVNVLWKCCWYILAPYGCI